ncbi:interleukin-18 receptor accessory protein-like [Erpetoichthys calabaricus]|uniref:interleukin-18 receptor accessory protein-like n=1 Tax=Erpetoichthys calabaricus TaxID=27687 RepID=UPI00223464A3|nr:interleukin-18 receptor accessory protein-like [Erpetoichthys calabaricus]
MPSSRWLFVLMCCCLFLVTRSCFQKTTDIEDVNNRTRCDDQELLTKYIVVSMAVELTCPGRQCYDASRRSPVKWYKDGKQILMNEEKRESLKIKNGDLHLNIVYLTDAGLYTCEFHYTHNGTLMKMRRSLSLQVSGKQTKVPPLISIPPEGKRVEAELGKPLLLECKITFGFDKNFDPIMKWMVVEKASESIQLEKEQCRLENEDIQQRIVILSAQLSKVTEGHFNAQFICFAGNSVGNSTGTVTLVKTEQVSKPVLTITLIVIVVMALSVFVGSASFRLYWIEIVLLFRSYFGRDETVGDGKEFDAFVSFAKDVSSEESCEREDKNLISEEVLALKLLPDVLEMRWGYKLCLLERDVLPGGAYTEDITSSMKKSRRVIYILSQRYLSSTNIFELQTGITYMLEDKTFKPILVKFTSLPQTDGLPDIVQRALKVLPIINWKDSTSVDPDSKFWKSLKYYMPIKKTQLVSWTRSCTEETEHGNV